MDAAGLLAADLVEPLSSPDRVAFAAKAAPSKTTAAKAPADEPLSLFLAFLAAFFEALEAVGDAFTVGAAVLPSFRFFKASASVPEKRLVCLRWGSTFEYREEASRAGDVVANASGTAPARSESDAAPATASLSALGCSAEATTRGAATARDCEERGGRRTCQCPREKECPLLY